MLDFNPEPLLAAFATLYLVSLGHSLMERSGVLNLAIDGVFFLSTGIAVSLAVSLYNYLSPLGFEIALPALAAILLTGVLTSLIGVFMAWTLTALPVNHGALGLSLQFVGYGLGVMIGYPTRQYTGSIEPYTLPHGYTSLLTPLILVLTWGLTAHVLLDKTTLGASIKACGENPHAASSLGVDVLKTRIIAGALGFYILGVGSALYPLAWQRYWDIQLYRLGYGWLAFTIALASGRRPLHLIPLSLFFGGLVEYSIRLQAVAGIPVDVAKLIPFAATLGVMVLYGATRLRRIYAPPSSLGRLFYREDRST